MKTIIALATATALLAGGSAFAADSSHAVRLADNDMDSVSAGFLNNIAVFVPITNVQTQQSATAVGVIANDTTAVNSSYTSVKNNFYVYQKSW